MKNILEIIKKNWLKFVFVLIFIAVFVIFLTLETSIYFKIIVGLMLVFGIWRLVEKHDIDWILLLSLYLGFYDLFSFYDIFSFFNIWIINARLVIPVLVFIISSLLYYFYFVSHKVHLTAYIYTVFIGILELEIFLALIPWPIDPKGKSLIMVGSFYFLSEILKSREEGRISFKRALSFAILMILIIFLVISTSQWLVR